MVELETSLIQVENEIFHLYSTCAKLVDKNPIYQEKSDILQDSLTKIQTLSAQVFESGKEEDDAKLKQELIQILSNLIVSGGKWEQNNLLKAMAQKLQILQDKLILGVQEDAVQAEAPKEQKRLASLKQKADMIIVFILLYQADGFNMNKWAALLNSVSDLSTSRPIYQQEADIQAVIHAKEYKQNEAYAAIYIFPDDIVPAALVQGQTEKDKKGHPLFFVKEGALKLQNLAYFVHDSGRYILEQGHLVRQQEEGGL